MAHILKDPIQTLEFERTAWMPHSTDRVMELLRKHLPGIVELRMAWGARAGATRQRLQLWVLAGAEAPACPGDSVVTEVSQRAGWAAFESECDEINARIEAECAVLRPEPDRDDLRGPEAQVTTRHLEAVPEAEQPAPRVSTERLEIPTGGDKTADGLLRELCRHAFRGALVGFAIENDRTGLRCWVTVRGTAEQIDRGSQMVLRVLLALGFVAPKKSEEPPPSPPNPEQSAP